MAMNETPVPYLRECFDLDEATGEIRWKVRPVHHFSGEHGWRTTNGRSAGKLAGSRASKGYTAVEIDGVSYRVHRVVYALAFGRWPHGDIDHENGDPTDNRPVNLRDVSNTVNMVNKGVYRINASGEPNISYRKASHISCRWHVQIVYGGVKHQAYFSTLEYAIIWRDQKRKELGFHPNHGRRPGYARSQEGMSS